MPRTAAPPFRTSPNAREGTGGDAAPRIELTHTAILQLFNGVKRRPQCPGNGTEEGVEAREARMREQALRCLVIRDDILLQFKRPASP